MEVSPRRPALLAIGLIAALIAASLAVYVRALPAGASGESMALEVYANTAKTQLVCGQGALSRTCQIAQGSIFSVDVLATNPPADGYTAIKIVIDYASNLTLKQQGGLQESTAPKCNLGSEKKSAGRYGLNCKVVPTGQGQDPIPTHYNGTLANIHFTCDQGSGRIDLLGGDDADSSVYVRSGSVATFRFPLKSQGKAGKLVADAVTIVCVPPTPTPTPTPVPPTPTFTFTPVPPTPTFTPTPIPPTPTFTDTPVPPTPTPTSGPVGTITPLPTPGAQGCTPGYWKNHPGSWAPTGLSPDDPFEVVFGTAPAPFNNDPTMLEALSAGGGGVVALSRHAAAALLNATHPDIAYALTAAEVIAAYQAAIASGDRDAIEALKDKLDAFNNGGCSIDAQGNPIATSTPLPTGEAKPTPSDKDGDDVSDGEEELVFGTDPTEADSDSDGCADGRELSDDPASGGRRDPTNRWDFYDVAGPNGGAPDGVIDLANDILGVIQRYTANGGAYDASFDRGPSTGPHTWNMTAPDGVIDLANDILGVILQYLHDCR